MTYPESSPIDGIETIIVAVDDGTVFRASPVYFGGTNAPYPKHIALRWSLQRLSEPPHGDTSPNAFIGPPIQTDRSPNAVRALINEWWRDTTLKDL